MANFNFSFDPGTSLQQMIGFETAGRIWSSYLTDPVTVNLQVGVSDSLGSNVIGGALPGMSASQSYRSFTTALKADATSADDLTALRQVYGSNFSATYQLSANGLTTQWMGTGSSLNLTRANAKAVGLAVTGDATSLDGYILFGSLTGAPVQWNYDYTRSAAAPANSLDFLSTALHEIGHVLGFASGLDSPNWVDSNFGSDVSGLLAITSQLNVITNGATALDLFRYSTNWLNSADKRDFTLGGTKVFALSSGSNPIANFSTGVETSQGGNGYEASHWAIGTNSIEAPTLQTGTRSAIAAIDLQAMDVIGWNLSSKGISTAIDLSALQTQSKQALATRLGQTVSWLDANTTTAAQALVQDRSQDVYTMAANSQIYDLSRLTPPGSGGTAKLIYTQLFQEQGLFETIDELEVLPNLTVQPNITVQPSLKAVVATALSQDYLNKITPPGGGGTVKLIYTLPQSDTAVRPSLEAIVATALPQADLNKITPPGSGGTVKLIYTLPQGDTAALQQSELGTANPVNQAANCMTQSVQPLPSTTSAPGSDRLFTAQTSYGSSNSVAYEGVTKSAPQSFDPLAFLTDLSTVL